MKSTLASVENWETDLFNKYNNETPVNDPVDDSIFETMENIDGETALIYSPDGFKFFVTSYAFPARVFNSYTDACNWLERRGFRF